MFPIFALTEQLDVVVLALRIYAIYDKSRTILIIMSLSFFITTIPAVGIIARVLRVGSGTQRFQKIYLSDLTSFLHSSRSHHRTFLPLSAHTHVYRGQHAGVLQILLAAHSPQRGATIRVVRYQRCADLPTASKLCCLFKRDSFVDLEKDHAVLLRVRKFDLD